MPNRAVGYFPFNAVIQTRARWTASATTTPPRTVAAPQRRVRCPADPDDCQPVARGGERDDVDGQLAFLGPVDILEVEDHGEIVEHA